MVADSERNYTGTNFAVITLAALLFAVLAYLMVAQVNDVSNDNVGQMQRQSAFR